MSTAVRRETRAGGALARERLAAYRRYADLVRCQEAALVAGDLEGFRALADEALALQEGLGPALSAAALSQDPDAAGHAFLDEVAELLRSALGGNERIQARLGALRSQAGDSVRRASAGHRRVQGYAGAAFAGGAARLDLTL